MQRHQLGPDSPILSKYSCSGCFAYACDFTKYVYGIDNYQNGSDFYSVSEIRDGDVIRISGHTFVVLKHDGNNLYTAEGAFSDAVRVVNPGYKISESGLTDTWGNAKTFVEGYHFEITDDSYVDIGVDFYAYTIQSTAWKHITCDSSFYSSQLWLAESNDGLDPRQIWHFVRQSNGSYAISSAYWDDYYIQPEGNGTSSGTIINLGYNNGSAGQQWFVSGNSPQYLRAGNSSLALDVDSGYALGTKLQLYAVNYSSAQQFNIYKLSNNGRTYNKPAKPIASSYTGPTTSKVDSTISLTWSDSPKVNDFDRRAYEVWVTNSNGVKVFEQTNLTDMSCEYEVDTPGTYTVQVRTVNGYYRDWYTDGPSSTLTITPVTVDISDATVTLPYAFAPCTGVPITPTPTVTLGGEGLVEGVDYEVSYSGNVSVGTATVSVTGIGDYEGTVTATFRIARAADGWVDLADGAKGYGREGKLVRGWLDLDDAKYWFDDEGRMATGWTDLEVDGKQMHYYFRPSGNLARGSWADIDGTKYYFRPSGNMATGWADIDGKKYWFDESGQMVTGWQDIVNDNGVTNHYYFRPSGSMATGWAGIDGSYFYFRPSGNIAIGFTDVTDDAYKRYFDTEGRMLTGWQDISGNTYYFRASGAMQTGTATIDGMVFTFNDKGVLVDDDAKASWVATSEPGAVVEPEAGASDVADALEPDIEAELDAGMAELEPEVDIEVDVEFESDGGLAA